METKGLIHCQAISGRDILRDIILRDIGYFCLRVDVYVPVTTVQQEASRAFVNEQLKFEAKTKRNKNQTRFA